MANAARDDLTNNIFAREQKTAKNGYRQRGATKIIKVHQKCGGNIIKQNQCIWCEKCMKYFCNCVS